MKYTNTITLKNCTECCIRSAAEDDEKAVLHIFNLTHDETDYLASYADESTLNEQQEYAFLKAKAESKNEVQLVAVVNGVVVGTAGIEAVGNKYKGRHHTEFGMSVLKAYWGLGIERALMDTCIECAKVAGYVQLELSVVAENRRAVTMYEKVGFLSIAEIQKRLIPVSQAFRKSFTCNWNIIAKKTEDCIFGLFILERIY